MFLIYLLTYILYYIILFFKSTFIIELGLVLSECMPVFFISFIILCVYLRCYKKYDDTEILACKMKFTKNILRKTKLSNLTFEYKAYSDPCDNVSMWQLAPVSPMIKSTSVFIIYKWFCNLFCHMCSIILLSIQERFKRVWSLEGLFFFFMCLTQNWHGNQWEWKILWRS